MTLPQSKSTESWETSFYFEGDDFFRDLREAIVSARSSIDIEIYYFASDPVGYGFAELLKTKASEGVGVRIIYDAIGCIRTSEDLFLEMDHAGIRLKAYHPISRLFRLKGRFTRRNHRKYAVIDGRVAFLGGFNLASEYSASTCGPKAWRDSGARVTSPELVSQFQEIFRHSWEGRVRRAMDFLERRGWRALRESGARILANYGWRRKNLIREAYFNAVRNARRDVWITNSYFIPPLSFRSVLRWAARRGVDVRILTAGVSDVPFAQWAGQATYSRLLRAGVRIFEFQGRILHAKSATVDGGWYTVGTANLDHLSFFKNLEVNLFGVDGRAAGILNAQFQKDLAHSIEIDLASWRNRPWWMKLREKVFFWLRAWL